MKKMFFGIIASTAVFIAYLSFSDTSLAGYEKMIRDSRMKRENYLEKSSDSPFVLAEKKMKELSYFEIDPKYKISANVEKIETRQFVTLSSSNGTTQRHLRYAYLDFKIDGKSIRLVVLKPMFAPSYFLAFRDKTSGQSTYSGGRYLEINDLRSDQVTLDFNLAYNPFCAYDKNFVCPLPLAENEIDLKIEAGEMNY